MNYKDIKYVVRARPGRDQSTFVISYPRSANPTEVRFGDHEMKQLPLRAAGLMVG
jgi:hypothetical protein